MQNIHPLFVHFPIALLSMSLALYITSIVLKRENLIYAADIALIFGTIGAWLSVLTGYLALQGVPHTTAVHQILELHRAIAIFISALAFVLSMWRLASPEFSSVRAKVSFLFAMGVLVSALFFSAHLGGRLVYEHGIGGSYFGPKVETHEHEHPH